MTPAVLLLKGGTLIDGTGAPRCTGDLLVAAGRIASVGVLEAPKEATVMDCAGLVVSPGFIDSHSHSDLQVMENRPEKVRQGVTTEVVGNCGFSAYPARADRKALHEFANGIFRGDDGWGWSNAAEYLGEVERRTRFASVVSLVGHGSLRIAAAGPKLGALSERELDTMEGCLEDALTGGAAGFSTGLMYAPGSSAPAEELERCCRVVARHGKTYATHIRGYSFHLEEFVEEQLNLARKTSCRLQISHFQTVGRMNWDRQQHALELIERARREGVDVEFDCYPYVAGSTVATQLLPQWTLDGGMEALLARLADVEQRERIASETIAGLPHRWEDIVISAVGSSRNESVVGKNIQEIAGIRSQEPVEALMDLIGEEQGAVNIISFNQSEDNLRQSLCHPLSSVISDGFYVHGRPHPRLYGTFPRLLGTVCREEKWMPLEQAIHKITAKPAERFHIEGRGMLKQGFAADVVVFDPDTVDSPATYENPQVYPQGIHAVLRNGKTVWASGTWEKLLG
jgi:dihydroorotase/N-acyl-D-amino-acid deacylase